MGRQFGYFCGLRLAIKVGQAHRHGGHVLPFRLWEGRQEIIQKLVNHSRVLRALRQLRQGVQHTGQLPSGVRGSFQETYEKLPCQWALLAHVQLGQSLDEHDAVLLREFAQLSVHERE